MSSYRTKKRAVVHPVKSAKSFKPFCDLDFRGPRELKDQLTTYMRQFVGVQRVEIDTSIGGILVDGVHRYDYELIEPAASTKPVAVMF